MQDRTKPPFRADHVGSLIRPDALIEARAAADKGEMAAAELAHIQHGAVRDVVRLQRDAGPLRPASRTSLTCRLLCEMGKRQ